MLACKGAAAALKGSGGGGGLWKARRDPVAAWLAQGLGWSLLGTEPCLTDS